MRAIVKYGLLFAIVVAAIVGFVLSQQDLNRLRPLIAETVKDATGRDFEIAGSIKLGLGFSPAFVAEDIRLQNAMFGTRAEMIKARKLEAHVALLPLMMGRVEINRFVLIGPDILLETDEQGRRNWDFRGDDEPVAPARGGSAVQTALELPKLGAVTIQNGLLTYRNGLTGTTTKIAISRFTGRSASREAPLDVQLSATYDGTPFRVTGRLGAFATLGSPGAFPIELTAEMSELQATVKGTVSRPLAPSSSKLSIAINSKNISILGSVYKVSLPAESLSLTGQLLAEKGVVSLTDIKAKFADSDLQGRLRLDPGKERRLLTASLTSRHLDLADFLPPEVPSDSAARTAGAANGAPEDGRLISASPLPFDLLKQLDFTIDAKAERLVIGRVLLDDAALTARLRDGKLTIDPLTGVLAEGQLRLGMLVDGSQRGEARVSLQLSGVEVGALAKVFDSGDVLTGKADVTALLTGQGDSLRAMMASLDGRTSIVMGSGQFKSSLADMMGADLLSFSAASGPSEMTPVYCLVGHFNVAGGRVASRDILFDTGKMTVRGAGEVSLGEETLALAFTTNPKDSVVGVKAPWRVSGPLRQLQVDGDVAETLFSAINPFDNGGEGNPCPAALASLQPTAQPLARVVTQPLKPEPDALENSSRD